MLIRMALISHFVCVRRVASGERKLCPRSINNRVRGRVYTRGEVCEAVWQLTIVSLPPSTMPDQGAQTPAVRNAGNAQPGQQGESRYSQFWRLAQVRANLKIARRGD